MRSDLNISILNLLFLIPFSLLISFYIYCSKQIISSDLFKLLKQMHGSSYEAFMKRKLIPVIGDIEEDNLGIKSEIANMISEEIDVIISCGGRTTFDDRCLFRLFLFARFFRCLQTKCNNLTLLLIQTNGTDTILP